MGHVIYGQRTGRGCEASSTKATILVRAPCDALDGAEMARRGCALPERMTRPSTHVGPQPVVKRLSYDAQNCYGAVPQKISADLTLLAEQRSGFHWHDVDDVRPSTLTSLCGRSAQLDPGCRMKRLWNIISRIEKIFLIFGTKYLKIDT